MSASSATMAMPLVLPQRWKHALGALFLSLAWTTFLYRDAARAMVAIWSRSETFMHGFLVIPIVLWLVWRQRLSIAKLFPEPALPSFLLVAFAGFAWVAGELVAANALTQLAFVALLALTVPCVLGGTVARLIIFPLGFMFFAVPIGDFLLPQLMEWTANFTVSALRLSGVPVYREGLNFIIPSGHWSVVEACSGVRYLIASVTVGSLFAYLNYQSGKRRATFVMVSLLVPIVANWIRAYMIVMLGHFSGNKLATGVDHLIYGWVFFGVVILLMFFVGSHWTESEKMVISTASVVNVANPTVTVGRLWGATACFAVLVALPHIALWSAERGVGSEAVQLNMPAAAGAGWIKTDPASFGFKPAFQNPSAEISAAYEGQGQAIGLYVGYYQHQGYSHKLVSSDNVLVVNKDPHWALVSRSDKSAFLGNDMHKVRTSELRGTALTASDQDAQLVVWQTYWIHGKLTTSDYLATVYSAMYRLMGQGDDSAVIVLYARKGDGGQGEFALESFLSSSYAVINETLSSARQKH